MEEKEIQQYEKMVLTPADKLIAKLAVPTIISMMISMIYNLVDAFFVGKLGTSASAAIGILMGIQTVFQAVRKAVCLLAEENYYVRLNKKLIPKIWLLCRLKI